MNKCLCLCLCLLCLQLILPELVADVFIHRNRIPRARRYILRHNPFIHPHRLREPYTYHTIRVVRVNLPKRAIGHRLVLRVVFVVKEELQHLAQGIILPLQFDIKPVLNSAYRRDDMILPAFDIADELRTLINHNLRGLAHDIRVRVDAHCFHDEIETVVFCVALRIQERPVLPLGFHFFASDGGDTLLHDFGFLDAPGLVDLGGVHRHTVGARTDDVERTVLFSGCNIQVACHRQLLAFTVFRHFREEAGELDIVACDWIRWEDFAAFDIGEVFA